MLTQLMKVEKTIDQNCILLTITTRLITQNTLLFTLSKPISNRFSYIVWWKFQKDIPSNRDLEVSANESSENSFWHATNRRMSALF